MDEDEKLRFILIMSAIVAALAVHRFVEGSPRQRPIDRGALLHAKRYWGRLSRGADREPGLVRMGGGQGHRLALMHSSSAAVSRRRGSAPDFTSPSSKPPLVASSARTSNSVSCSAASAGSVQSSSVSDIMTQALMEWIKVTSAR